MNASMVEGRRYRLVVKNCVNRPPAPWQRPLTFLQHRPTGFTFLDDVGREVRLATRAVIAAEEVAG